MCVAPFILKHKTECCLRLLPAPTTELCLCGPALHIPGQDTSVGIAGSRVRKKEKSSDGNCSSHVHLMLIHSVCPAAQRTHCIEYLLIWLLGMMIMSILSRILRLFIHSKVKLSIRLCKHVLSHIVNTFCPCSQLSLGPEDTFAVYWAHLHLSCPKYSNSSVGI